MVSVEIGVFPVAETVDVVCACLGDASVGISDGAGEGQGVALT